jgi:hypothetical protein
MRVVKGSWVWSLNTFAAEVIGVVASVDVEDRICSPTLQPLATHVERCTLEGTQLQLHTLQCYDPELCACLQHLHLLAQHRIEGELHGFARIQ